MRALGIGLVAVGVQIMFAGGNDQSASYMGVVGLGVLVVILGVSTLAGCCDVRGS